MLPAGQPGRLARLLPASRACWDLLLPLPLQPPPTLLHQSADQPTLACPRRPPQVAAAVAEAAWVGGVSGLACAPSSWLDYVQARMYSPEVGAALLGAGGVVF